MGSIESTTMRQYVSHLISIIANSQYGVTGADALIAG
jgi:hypothetical protein